jgi:hypothetical protein
MCIVMMLCTTKRGRGLAVPAANQIAAELSIHPAAHVFAMELFADLAG